MQDKVNSETIVLKLKVLAEEKEEVRKKLAVTAEVLRLKAKELATTAREKEEVRKKLALKAEELRKSRQTLEQTVLERTKDLAESKAKDEAILASIGDGLVAIDEDGKVMIINQAGCKLLGFKADELLGKKFVDVVLMADEKGDIISEDKRPASIVFSGTTTTTTTTYYYTRKDGSRFPVASIITPISLDQKIIGAVEVFRDITKEKEIGEMKENELQHEKDFISMASHQLLTPLALMKGYISMLISGKLGKIDEVARKYLDESLRGGERMSNLIKSLLTTSRIESGNIKIAGINFDLDELVLSVAAELKPKLDDKKLTLKMPTPKKLMVFADKDQTREVLMNVLDNAIKYTQKGTITITESQKKGMGIVSIKDSGIGINQKDLPHIFEKFYASENWLQTQSTSHGLGLYIADLLLKLMGGSIKAESKKGQGSVFSITFPLGKTEK